MGKEDYMANNYSVTLGEIKYYSDFSVTGMPVTEVIVRNPEGEETIIGYLSPFRHYKFQISMTFEGETCLGDTDVIPDMRDQIKNMRPDMAKAFIKGQIMWALVNYSNTTYGHKAANGGLLAVLPKFNDMVKLDSVALEMLKYLTASEE